MVPGRLRCEEIRPSGGLASARSEAVGRFRRGGDDDNRNDDARNDDAAPARDVALRHRQRAGVGRRRAGAGTGGAGSGRGAGGGAGGAAC